MAKVLVIDDDEDFREVVKDLLEDLGHESFLAADPDEGKKCCNENSVEVIFCDLVMPMDPEEDDGDSDSVMVGIHAIHDFTKNFPGIPVVAMSGQMDDQPLRAIQNFGAIDSIAKPFGREDLKKVLTRVLKRAEEVRA